MQIRWLTTAGLVATCVLISIGIGPGLAGDESQPDWPERFAREMASRAEDLDSELGTARNDAYLDLQGVGRNLALQLAIPMTSEDPNTHRAAGRLCDEITTSLELVRHVARLTPAARKTVATWLTKARSTGKANDFTAMLSPDPNARIKVAWSLGGDEDKAEALLGLAIRDPNLMVVHGAITKIGKLRIKDSPDVATGCLDLLRRMEREHWWELKYDTMKATVGEGEFRTEIRQLVHRAFKALASNGGKRHEAELAEIMLSSDPEFDRDFLIAWTLVNMEATSTIPALCKELGREDNAPRSTMYIASNTQEIVIEYRHDAVLAAVILLMGKQPEDYGMVRDQPWRRLADDYYQYGFPDTEDTDKFRKRAVKQALADAKKLRKAKADNVEP